jgi:hypothetical protein
MIIRFKFQRDLPVASAIRHRRDLCTEQFPRTKDSVRELIMRRLLDYEYSYPPTALVITSEAG